MAIGSHHRARSVTDEWLTPPEIVAALGPFDLDPCAPIVRPWPTAASHFTIHDNGLLRQWFGRIWLNPPYSQVARWMGRMAHHGAGTALIFARTETAWWFRSIWPVAHAVFFLQGRLNFHLPNGRRSGANAGAPSVLVAYGEEDAERLASADLAGQFVPLRLPAFLAVLVPAEGQTWREAVGDAMTAAGGPVRLDELYRALSRHPKTQRNPHWREKVRQTLQMGGFTRLAPGVWALA